MKVQYANLPNLGLVGKNTESVVMHNNNQKLLSKIQISKDQNKTMDSKQQKDASSKIQNLND